LLERGDLVPAEKLVQEELTRGDSGRLERAELQTSLGEILEKQGRAEEALASYFIARGERSGEVLPRAWDGIARIRFKAGDDVGTARAKMRAWDNSEPGARKERERDLTRALSLLSDRDLDVLSRSSSHFASYGFVLEELDKRARGEPANELTIALLAPLSGRLSNFGRAFQAGAELALEDRSSRADSARAAVLKVRLVRRDTEGDLLRATQAARDAILEDGSCAIVGPLLSVTSIGAGSVAQSFGVPLIAPIATDAGLSKIGPFVQTLAPSARDLVSPLAEFSVQTLGNLRHGILVARDGFSEELETEFRAAIEHLGGKVAVSIAFDPGETDFRRHLEHLIKEDVDAVYVPAGPSDLENLAPQLEFYEFDRTILGNGGWTSSRVLETDNRALEGAIFSVEAADDPSSEFWSRLREGLTSKKGEEISRFHVRGYQAMAALLGAIDQGARDGEEIVELLKRRQHWTERLPGEKISILTFRDGVLGPASWATKFDLPPRAKEVAETPRGNRE
jgi:branched-chain amino acid transport system substrate-binding protein